MEKEKRTQQILNLILEILYLLTGEDYIIVKKPGRQTAHKNKLQVVEGICRTLGNVIRTPPHCVTPKEDNEQKILELASKITEMLTREVPIRCQDVAVYFSMEEWEYIEEHKDLYQDVTMENHQNTVLPDGSTCRNRPFNNVTPDLVNEDVMPMDTESGTEKLIVHNSREMKIISNGMIPEKTSGYQNRSLRDVDPNCDSSIHIKEEPYDASWDEENVPITTTHSPAQLHSIHIKEELISYDEENVPDARSYTPTDHTQHHSSPSMEELISCDRGNLTKSNIHTPTDHTQHHPPPIMEELISCDRGNLTKSNIHTPTDHTQHHPPPIMEELISSDRGNLTKSNIHTPTDHTQHHPPPIMEELISCDRGNLTKSNIHTTTDHTQHHPSPHSIVEAASSNKEDLNDSNLVAQHLSIHIKESPFSREDHEVTKTRRYPTRQSTSTLVKQRGTALHNRRKRKNFKNTIKEPLVESTTSGDCKTEVQNEEINSSSIYSVRQSADTMEILYHCPSCHKGFFSNLDLARHQVTHTVDKLFICSSCGKSFTELSFLVKHQVIHTDLKLCVCPVCGGCFYSETSLAKHQKSHSLPLYCSICGRCFFSKTELEIHKRKHTGERPYACRTCGKHFFAKSVLNRHMLTHKAAEQSK